MRIIQARIDELVGCILSNPKGKSLIFKELDRLYQDHNCDYSAPIFKGVILELRNGDMAEEVGEWLTEKRLMDEFSSNGNDMGMLKNRVNEIVVQVLPYLEGGKAEIQKLLDNLYRNHNCDSSAPIFRGVMLELRRKYIVGEVYDWLEDNGIKLEVVA